jgi:Rrf2 family nitric oxide-sensitive transcriptional repressor
MLLTCINPQARKQWNCSGVKLTRYTDYALRVLQHLAQHTDRLCSIHELSEACGAPENHVMKVTPLLVRGGFIASARGRGGGLKLAKTAGDIRLGAVVRLTEGGLDLGDCQDCKLGPDCGMHNVLTGASDAFLSHLDTVTLADVLKSKTA